VSSRAIAVALVVLVGAAGCLGAPAADTTTAGDAQSRYRTGADGLVAAEITDPEIVEFEAVVAEK